MNIRIKAALPIIAMVAALSACGTKKDAALTGTWKVTGVDLKPDSLNKPGMIDPESMKKVRFTFKADSTVTITDGGTNSNTGRYAVEKVGSESFLVMRPVGQGGEVPPPGTEQRMRIVSRTSDKLDLEQKFDPYTFTTHLEIVR